MFFDLIGALFSLLSTYYFIRMNNKAWGIGMIATCLNGGLYWYKGIYADMALELFYFFTMIYGWHTWHNNEKNMNTQIITLKKLTFVHWVLLGFLFCIVFTLIYLILVSYTHSSIPALDTLTTTLSLVAQWLMCHKIIMTWVFWFITDTFYVWLYFTKALPFHAILMLIYTGMAVTGYIVWSRTAKNKVANTLLDAPI